MCLLHHIAGAFTREPEEIKQISTNARDLIKRAFDDIDPTRLLDYHTHIAGIGNGTNGTFVNPKMRTWRHPLHKLKFKVYLSASAINDVERSDAQIVHRLTRLITNIEGHGRHRLLAFDKNYRRDGTTNLAKTEFYVPNDYVFDLAAEHPHLFEPVISVNPYRPQALTELERGARCAHGEVAAERYGHRSCRRPLRSVLSEDERTQSGFIESRRRRKSCRGPR